MHRESGRRIGTDTRQRDVRHIHQAQVHDRPQAHNQQNVSEQRRRDTELIVVNDHDRKQHCDEEKNRRYRDRTVALRTVHDFMIPVGLTKSKKTIATNPSSSTAAADRKIGPMLSSTPNRAPPTIAPGRLPIPPRITMMKAFTTGSVPMVGLT